MNSKDQEIKDLKEQLKTMAETEKLQAETVKLYAERDKMFWETKSIKHKYYAYIPVTVASLTFAALAVASKLISGA